MIFSGFSFYPISTLPAKYDNSVKTLFYQLLNNQIQEEKVFLVEIDFNPNNPNTDVLEVSNIGYNPPDLGEAAYEPRLENAFNFTSKITQQNFFQSETSVGTGNIIILNGDGGLDSKIMNKTWDGKPITIKLGTKSFPSINDFGLIFNGIIDQITYDESKITVRLRDRYAKVQNNIQNNLYLGTGGTEGPDTLKNKVKPLCYGRCLNISPILVDASTLTYQIHDGSIQAIETVYDRGNSVAFTPTLSNGTFTLSAQSTGAITCDVQGSNVKEATEISTIPAYAVQTADIIGRLLAKFGFTTADIDLISVNLVNNINTDGIGIYINQPRQLNQILDDLAFSIGAFWGFDRLGKFYIKLFNEPGTANISYDKKDLFSLRREPTNIPLWKANLLYDKNWTIQDRGTLAGIISETRAQEVSQEGKIISISNQLIELNGTPDISVTDNFTDVDNTNIVNHSTTFTWKKQQGSGLENAIILGNEIVAITLDTFSPDLNVYADVIPVSADYSVSALVNVLSIQGHIGIAVRHDPTYESYYGLLYDGVNLYLTAQSTNGANLLKTINFPLSNFLMKLKVTGNKLEIFINSVLLDSFIDTENLVTQVGKPAIIRNFSPTLGIPVGTNDTATTGIHLDDFSFEDNFNSLKLSTISYTSGVQNGNTYDVFDVEERTDSLLITEPIIGTAPGITDSFNINTKDGKVIPITSVKSISDIRVKHSESKEFLFKSLLSSTTSATDALNEVNRLNKLFSKDRDIWEVTIKNVRYDISLGDTLTITSDRFNLNKSFNIIGISENSKTDNCVLRLWG